MSQQNDSGFKTFTATSAVYAWHLVKLTAASGTHVELCGVGGAFIGVAQHDAGVGEFVTVKLRGMYGTFKCMAAEAMAVGASIYAAAAGHVADTAVGDIIGVALEVASTAGGDVVECLLDNTAPSALDSDNLANDDPDEEGAIPFVVSAVITDCFTAKVVVATLKRKAKVIDWWMVSRDTTASSITLYNGTTNAMNTALAKGTADATFVRGATLIAAYDEVAAGGTIQVAGGTEAAAFDVFVMLVPIA